MSRFLNPQDILARLIPKDWKDAKGYDFNTLILKFSEAVRCEGDFADFLKSIDKSKDYLLNRLQTNADGDGRTGVDYKLAVLKIANLLVAKYQFLRRDSVLLSRPFGLLVDPSNGCNLHCPGCVHSPTVPVKFAWPSALLTEGLFRSFIEAYGPYAFKIGFFNYGEPLLNKLTPQFIRLSKSYLLDTFLSTNLSLNIDADSIVSSGLDYMIVSLDGTTPETYSRYRRGGRFNVVVDNIRRLVEAKRKQGTSKPYIVWQFLMFEHNSHETESAKELANSIGVDELHLMVPFSVAWDDPGIAPSKTCDDECIYFHNSFEDTCNHDAAAVDWDDPERASKINALYSLKWHEQYKQLILPLSAEHTKMSDEPTCPWLYKGIVMDALGRILPCCGAPNEHVNLVYSRFEEGNPGTWFSSYNSDMFVRSRESFSNRRSFEKECADLAKGAIPYCSKCQWNKNTFFANKGDLMSYFLGHDLLSILDEQSMSDLTDW